MEENEFKKILHWNIGIYFGYSLFNIIMFMNFLEAQDTNQNTDFYFFLKFSIYFLPLHALIDFIFFIYYFIQRQHEIAKAYLLSLLLILLIGFPICYKFLK